MLGNPDMAAVIGHRESSLNSFDKVADIYRVICLIGAKPKRERSPTRFESNKGEAQAATN
jgi:hypothetical protein